MKKAFLSILFVGCLFFAVSWQHGTVSCFNPKKGQQQNSLLRKGGNKAQSSQRRLKVLKVAHDLLLAEGKGVDADFFDLIFRRKLAA